MHPTRQHCNCWCFTPASPAGIFSTTVCSWASYCCLSRAWKLDGPILGHYSFASSCAWSALSARFWTYLCSCKHCSVCFFAVGRLNHFLGAPREIPESESLLFRSGWVRVGDLGIRGTFSSTSLRSSLCICCASTVVSPSSPCACRSAQLASVERSWVTKYGRTDQCSFNPLTHTHTISYPGLEYHYVPLVASKPSPITRCFRRCFALALWCLELFLHPGWQMVKWKLTARSTKMIALYIYS